ncbi:MULTISPECIES: radical SAM/SPASM domain-containing protein [unclassified Streptomyces]|uniref:radical SAM/SPASM domain-containing protein n=1 Tax=unclassified Streptomyces TaxID=2593676 RepID=UPI001650FDF3|nr:MULTISPECIES: radical SAM/SPASM domain-containing protein [unclassified Streptomyces]
MELEITKAEQHGHVHGQMLSVPQGAMTSEDWRAVIIDAARLGITRVQLIGGEPTTHPQWRDFAELALSRGLRVEVYSHLFHVKQDWWALFTRTGVTLTTSYYSDDPDEHDSITGRNGSYVRTRTNIREAVTRGVTVRAGIVRVLDGQRVAEARAELTAMGVTDITTDRVRALGGGTPPGRTPSLDELCGHCTRGLAAILPDGDLVGCVLARNFPVGNVREHRLAELLAGREWAALSASIPAPVTPQ